MTSPEAKELVCQIQDGITDVYHKPKLTDTGIAMFIGALKHLSFADAQAALVRHLQACRFSCSPRRIWGDSTASWVNDQDKTKVLTYLKGYHEIDNLGRGYPWELTVYDCQDRSISNIREILAATQANDLKGVLDYSNDRRAITRGSGGVPKH